MPRFTSLSNVIAAQISQTVPDIKFPDGSATNVMIGNVPMPDQFNIKKTASYFRWGSSTWGVDEITPDYSPKFNDGI
jgi:hypothetical protein